MMRTTMPMRRNVVINNCRARRRRSTTSSIDVPPTRPPPSPSHPHSLHPLHSHRRSPHRPVIVVVARRRRAVHSRKRGQEVHRSHRQSPRHGIPRRIDNYDRRRRRASRSHPRRRRSSPAAEENADDDARQSSAPVAPTPSNTASSLAVARYAARYIIVDDFIPPVAFAFVAFPFVAYRYVVLFIYFCTKRTIVGEEVTQNFPPLYEAPRINSYVGRNR